MAKIKEEMQEKRRKRGLYTVIAIVAGIVAFGAILYMIVHNMSLKEQNDNYEELRQTEMLEITETETETEIIVETETETEEIITCEAVYDFDELHETNEDIYAWITVPGTLVDYPVVQSEEDNYYLERNLDHSKGYPGCIYTNKCNVKTFDDLHTVLYGHNMKNDTMFGSLHDYEDIDNFNENRTILVYTEEKRLTYEIYAAVKFSDTYIPAVYGMNSEAGNEQFLQEVLNYAEKYSSVSHIADMEVTSEDKLITLSTCVAGENTRRYFVIGVLVEEAYYAE